MTDATAKTALVPIANGSEDMETAIIVDILRRAGARVIVASVETEHMCTMARGMKFVADCMLTACVDVQWDLIVLPGGMPGAERLASTAELITLLKAQRAAGKLVAAMCASPAVVLAPHGLAAGLAVTAHPAFVADVTPLASKGDSTQGRVVVDGDLVTSRGPGTAMEFALCLVEKLYDNAKALEVEAPLVMPQPVWAPRTPLVPFEWAGLHKQPEPEPVPEPVAETKGKKK